MPKSQIIKDIVEDTVPLETSLNRLYVLAEDVRNKPLADWATHELKGYADPDTLPDYRKTTSSTFVYSGINGNFQVTNVPFSMGWIPEEYRDRIIEVHAREGIKQIVAFSTSTNVIEVDRSAFSGYVSEDTGGQVSCTSIRQRIPQSFFSQICAEVKEKMLQALLELEKKYGNLDGLGIDVSSQTPIQLAADNNQLNQMVLNINVPQHEALKEKLPSKIAWNILVPIITGVLGAILGAVIITHLGL